MRRTSLLETDAPLAPGETAACASAGGPLVIVCDWIPPVFGAVGRYAYINAERAAAAGRRVCLVGLGQAAGTETLADGRLVVRRVQATPPDKRSLMRRALWTLSVNARLLAATAAAARELARAERVRAVDVTLTGSPPFFAYLYMGWNAVFRRDRIVYRMTDFYPETAIAAGKARWLRLFAPMFHMLRRAAWRIEVLGEDQRRRLETSRIPAHKIRLRRDESPVAFSAGDTPAPRPFEAEAVVLLYSGNLGQAHDPATFLAAYRRHVQEGSNRVRLWVNGSGVRVAELEAYCRQHCLPLHRTPPAELEKLPGILLAADAHLILLGDPFWGYVLPSKVYAAREAGQPILYVGPAESDIELLCQEDPHHLRRRNGDAGGVFLALEQLAAGARGAVPQAAAMS